MTPEEILSYPAKVLTQEQREHYFEYGYVGIKDIVPSDTLELIKKVTNEFINKVVRFVSQIVSLISVQDIPTKTLCLGD